MSRRLRKALERGLAADRGDRWPSMTELLGEIEASTRETTWLARLLRASRR